ncbi:pentapeptide repeat-containing protein [Tychonema sp. BBK16]|uniref:pentapeptide repeat-containing protein n=1 Tax=Tychonema sp. BBK16 TaxID=2699888 RepID=UPI001F2E1623|nr:pentapeptide repeat-containing protein [Tychonema sp. BBK16]
MDKAAECRKFIATEPLGKSGETAEQRVWDAVCEAFADRDCIAYWRYPIFSSSGDFRKEPDILIVDFELGLTIIEVKAIAIDQIISISGHRWEFQHFYTTGGNPYQQAEHQLYAMLGYCDRETALRGKVNGRAIVALPSISEQQWHEKEFNKLPSNPPIIFQNHLHGNSGQTKIATIETPGDKLNIDILSSPKTQYTHALIELIKNTTPVLKGNQLNREQWQLLLAVISGTPVFKPRPRRFYLSSPQTTQPENSLLSHLPNYTTRAAVLAQLHQQFSQLDLQQERIGKQIPPGPQRIRGIAGSGKTVLLCQKAALMHLKYPEWDIALVFFSRSLYEQIVALLDKWLRRFSNGEIGYDAKNNQKLRSLHAWGAQDRPGLYSTICRAAGVGRLTVGDTDFQEPSQALAYVCRHLLKSAKIPQIFDAILIDESQDLIVENKFNFQGKQPFFWMAYQSLRLVNTPPSPLLQGRANQENQVVSLELKTLENFSPPLQGGVGGGRDLRRLIWAYDEAQSLECLEIPTASKLFGEELGHLVSGEYSDGIKKTEIMHKCYRVPGPILTAAHGIGMGLLRRGGMLTGITHVEDWKAIGYEIVVDAKSEINVPIIKNKQYQSAQKVTICRPPDNSPNLVPKLWINPVLEFEAYRSRQEELTALAEDILYNLKVDGLRPSREILVIVLGSGFEAMELETYVANFLMRQGIDIYIPSTPSCNLLKVNQTDYQPDRFWCEGGVTVSRIHRAKGNEADMVYLVGFDCIAKDESNLSLRNQLFVALTRSKGWLKLSGTGAYPMYDEMWRVMQSGDSFTFTWKQHHQRNISVTDAGELAGRYAAGGRNFQGIDLSGSDLVGANLQRANLVNSKLVGADLKNANLDGTRLIIADLSGADLSNASFKKAKLVGAILNDAKLNQADLSYADLSEAQLRNADLRCAILTKANLSGADLQGANLEGADLTDVRLSGTMMPDGSVCGSD